MKKIKVILLTFIISTSVFSQDTLSKPKPQLWKTLTISHTFGLNREAYSFNQSSVNLFYEFKPNVAVTNWTGCQYPSAIQPGWFSSQTLMTRRIDKFMLGSGFQYNSQLQPPSLGSWFVVVNMSYRFKLN